jgi:hypothetical protein
MCLVKVAAVEVGALAKVPYSVEVEQALTFASPSGEIISLSKREGDFLMVPRHAVMAGGVDLRSTGRKVKFKVLASPLNSTQASLIESSYALLSEDKSHIIKAGTGTGKTYISLCVAARLGVTTLVVVTRDQMMEQWKRQITQFLGIPESMIGTLQQGTADFKGKPIVVGMLHSISRMKYPESFGYFGLVIFDEVHNLGSESFSVVAGMYSAKYRLGLSATPKRKDGKEIIFYSHIGPPLLRTSSTLMVPRVVTVATKFSTPMVKATLPSGRVSQVPMRLIPGRLANLLGVMAVDPERNALIAQLAFQSYVRGRHVVVFSDSAAVHLPELREFLIRAGVPSSDIGIFSPTITDKPDLNEHKERQVVLTTYRMCAEAVDRPRWDTAILATPRTDVVQVVGRVLRLHEDKDLALVFDILDVNIPLLSNYGKSRLKQYQTMGASIVHR